MEIKYGLFPETQKPIRGMETVWNASLTAAGAREMALDCAERDVPVFRETRRWLDIYFSGRQPDFTPRYHMDGLTPFRGEVVDAMLAIPFGETVTYGDIAAALAKKLGIAKMSAQAVGGAVGWNPICIIVPCHRVIGANRSLREAEKTPPL